MPSTVTVGGNDYTTNDSLDSATYCYKRSGVPFNSVPHFTVTDTDSGRARFRSFHVSKPSGNRWLRAYYDERTRQSMSSAAAGQQHSAVLLSSETREELDTLATAFWNAINT
ncbi:hypothetical protein [Pyxidicoccus sp. MSG2]|uniref:hypothetical protein n=1 Tax=Pyxidicoccus sp. MSG2 TaxID=2996790 RepID=UPI00226DB038|nr:hypothetical protein [Pyxidicoccus sp. MSG2]MCY1021510.1 hypothetical protein [Pyxidicoccus sp. MSG2]